MKMQAGKTKYARKGDDVTVEVTHSGENDVNEVVLFSATYGDELSPHVPTELYDLVGDRPTMLQPTSARLTKYRPKHIFTAHADEDTHFAVFQTVDYKTDRLAKARIERHGVFSKAIQRALANFRRWFGGNRAVARID
jgi:hypothetical protein